MGEEKSFPINFTDSKIVKTLYSPVETLVVKNSYFTDKGTLNRKNSGMTYFWKIDNNLIYLFNTTERDENIYAKKYSDEYTMRRLKDDYLPQFTTLLKYESEF
jgi:hypothetical protein